jgi:hypothetical protein
MGDGKISTLMLASSAATVRWASESSIILIQLDSIIYFWHHVPSFFQRAYEERQTDDEARKVKDKAQLEVMFIHSHVSQTLHCAFFSDG